MTTITASDVPRLPRGVRLRFDPARQAHILLAPERVFNLEGVAAEVLALVDGQRTVAAIVDALALKFQEERGVIEADVLALLGDLAKRRVLER